MARTYRTAQCRIHIVVIYFAQYSIWRRSRGKLFIEKERNEGGKINKTRGNAKIGRRYTLCEIDYCSAPSFECDERRLQVRFFPMRK